MSSRRAERLGNLVLCLLSTRQYLTAERIRAAVPGYEPDGGGRGDEAFKRMFERDKAERRDPSVPLETGRNSIFDAGSAATPAPGGVRGKPGPAERPSSGRPPRRRPRPPRPPMARGSSAAGAAAAR